MLWLRLKEIVGSKVYYYYQKEGKGEWGLLCYDQETDLCQCLKLAEGDTEDYEKYRDHAFCRIMDYCEEGHFPEKAIVAWG